MAPLAKQIVAALLVQKPVYSKQALNREQWICRISRLMATLDTGGEVSFCARNSAHPTSERASFLTSTPVSLLGHTGCLLRSTPLKERA